MEMKWETIEWTKCKEKVFWKEENEKKKTTYNIQRHCENEMETFFIDFKILPVGAQWKQTIQSVGHSLPLLYVVHFAIAP